MEKEFTRQELIDALANQTDGLSMESRNNSLSLFTKLGWEFDKKDKPSWTKW